MMDMDEKILLKSDNVFYAFSTDLEPVIRVKKGQLVEIETKDCFSNQINEENPVTEIDFSKVNPATDRYTLMVLGRAMHWL
jgi:amidase